METLWYVYGECKRQREALRRSHVQAQRVLVERVRGCSRNKEPHACTRTTSTLGSMLQRC